jgi:outer membrane protein TolC
VRTAFNQVTHADAALKAAKESAKQAGEALELATLAYRAGATTNLEVIDAERRARDAELVAVLAEDNARQARLDFLVASGAFPH